MRTPFPPRTVPCSNLYGQLNGLQLCLDVASLLWMNLFSQGLLRTLEQVKAFYHLQDSGKSEEHVDVRVDATQLRVRRPPRLSVRPSICPELFTPLPSQRHLAFYTAPFAATRRFLHRSLRSNAPLFTPFPSQRRAAFYTAPFAATRRFLHRSLRSDAPLFTPLPSQRRAAFYTAPFAATRRFLHRSLCSDAPLFTPLPSQRRAAFYTAPFAATRRFLHRSLRSDAPLFTPLPSQRPFAAGGTVRNRRQNVKREAQLRTLLSEVTCKVRFVLESGPFSISNVCVFCVGFHRRSVDQSIWQCCRRLR